MTHEAGTVTQNQTFLRDVMHGLSQLKKSLPCKYFYDERGSELFDPICELAEYYPTRTELSIVQPNAESIAYQIDKGVMLVEYGSGSSIKTRGFLKSLDAPVAYVPVDISEDHLLKTAESLRAAYPEIEILPVVADVTEPFTLPPGEKNRHMLRCISQGQPSATLHPTLLEAYLSSCRHCWEPRVVY